MVCIKGRKSQMTMIFLFRIVVADGSIAVRLSAIFKLISKKSLFFNTFALNLHFISPFTVIINTVLYKKFNDFINSQVFQYRML